ncbi:rhodanese-related sulfurtransferase [Anaerolinea thermolimosa]|nr:rhodanese-related sulfurtransferase [Anaerolinea thermolimosa]
MPVKKKNNQVSVPFLLIFGGLVLLSIGLIFLALNAPTTNASQGGTLDIPFPQIARVSLADAKSAYDKNMAIFIDVRDSGSYAASHIANALNIPLTELEGRLAEIPRDRWIITYCT